MREMDEKVVIDVARGFSSVLLALAAIFLGVAAFVKGLPYGDMLQLLLLSLTALHIVLAARVIDWIIDRIPLATWRALAGADNCREADFTKWHGFYFRLTLFGGAYFVFVIIMSAIASLAFYGSILRAQHLGVFFSFSGSLGMATSIKFLTSCLLFTYVLYQMMTSHTAGGRYIFAGGVFVIFAFMLKSVIQFHFL